MKWVVTYARVIDDKQKGISLGGVYFGGICDSEAAAQIIAKDCTHIVKNGMIVPKIAIINKNGDFKDALYDLYEQYLIMCDKMVQANIIYNKPKRRQVKK